MPSCFAADAKLLFIAHCGAFKRFKTITGLRVRDIAHERSQYKRNTVDIPTQTQKPFLMPIPLAFF
jgi:hypothetical protein